MSSVQPPSGFVLRDPTNAFGQAVGTSLALLPLSFVLLVLLFGFKVGLIIGFIALVVLVLVAGESLKAMLIWHPPQLEIPIEPWSLGSTPTVVYRRQPRRVIDVSSCQIEGRLLCVETAIIGEGNQSVNERRTVYESDCHGVGEGTAEGLVGELQVVIDVHSGAPSFVLESNEVEWRLELRAVGDRVPNDMHSWVIEVGSILDPRLRSRVQDS